MKLTKSVLTLCVVFYAVGTAGQSSLESGTGSISSTSSARTGGVESTSASGKGGGVSASTRAQVKTTVPAPSRTPAPTTPKRPPFPADFSTTESSLRTHLFQGNVQAAARVLRSSRVVSLAAGLTYPEELTPLVQPTANRNEDPDVVAFKALAQSALDTGEARKLATVGILSLRPDCKCAVISSGESDDLIDAFTKTFQNKGRLRAIVNADANKVEYPRASSNERASSAGVRSEEKEIDGDFVQSSTYSGLP